MLATEAARPIKGIPFGDLLIGATALSLGFSVLTANLRHFQKIPGLTVVPL
jgi:predicted nucleic acid-binding protein